MNSNIVTVTEAAEAQPTAQLSDNVSSVPATGGTVTLTVSNAPSGNVVFYGTGGNYYGDIGVVNGSASVAVTLGANITGTSENWGFYAVLPNGTRTNIVSVSQASEYIPPSPTTFQVSVLVETLGGVVLPNSSVELYDTTTSSTFGVTTTGSNGIAIFSNVPNDNYLVVVTPPSQYGAGTTTITVAGANVATTVYIS